MEDRGRSTFWQSKIHTYRDILVRTAMCKLKSAIFVSCVDFREGSDYFAAA
jgi:hypothetical protein